MYVINVLALYNTDCCWAVKMLLISPKPIIGVDNYVIGAFI